MKKAIIIGVILLIIGLVIGYVIFGKVAGHYVAIERVLGFSQGFGSKVVNSVIGLEKIRVNILLCGLAGFGVGFVLGLLSKKFK
ncbi:MAG: hypothetical protein KAT05_13550 [Spirochaetes bacterium]|nr:hypothetical protein [Spirochaetota bacterium]